ncbi:hypothetical protein FYK55_27100 [Roseiconus nitratireducens]|uniref:Uncharacterized protein n=1 Tax=Roseiconus nitratireducens TaxID=2605748 RepID=A0A5M6CXD2_9BACT|nr:hypothetical protein [Roseiconus nitratireducens]KAA5538652.1 hypothetical protein FYK55_27100 [Roseiconus nitratireducens]
MLLVFLSILSHVQAWATESAPSLDDLLRQFEEYSGARIVFHRDDLPEGKYHDVLRPLSDGARIRSVRICLDEVKLYPPRYFGDMGLTTIGVFDACVSRTTSDAGREYDHELGGYRYFGVYNGADAIAAAHYSDGQLALTFHHEVFHHVDSTHLGETGLWNLGTDDLFYRMAIAGERPYTAAAITPTDLRLLKDRRIGTTLESFVSAYAKKNPREDQAESARHFMSMMAASLIQAAEQPDLPGSQRILHILREYEYAVPSGPSIDWFVNVALQRSDASMREQQTLEVTLERLSDLASAASTQPRQFFRAAEESRRLLDRLVRMDWTEVSTDRRVEIAHDATTIAEAIMVARIHPDRAETRFDIWGYEDSDGVNRTLRSDVFGFGKDCERIGWIGGSLELDPAKHDEIVASTQRRMTKRLRNYLRFIEAHWSVSKQTRQIFDVVDRRMTDSIATPVR